MTKTWTVVLVTIQMTAELVLGTGGTGPLARIELPYLPEALISVLRATAPVSARSEEAPIALESHRQLFVDDFLISESEGVERRLNQPRKYEGNPVLSRVPEGEEAWEAGMPIAFSSVLHDPADGLFKLWYSLHAGSGGTKRRSSASPRAATASGGTSRGWEYSSTGERRKTTSSCLTAAWPAASSWTSTRRIRPSVSRCCTCGETTRSTPPIRRTAWTGLRTTTARPSFSNLPATTARWSPTGTKPSAFTSGSSGIAPAGSPRCGRAW